MKVRSSRKMTKSPSNVRRSNRKTKNEYSSTKRENSSPSQQAIEKTFNDLNDDCIEELLRRLPLGEAANMSMVNKRINTLSENLFKRLRKSNRFVVVLSGDRPEAQRIAIENSMPAFGKYIENLQVFGSTPLRKIYFDRLRMVNQFCGKNLQNFTLCNFGINTKTSANMRNLLRNIQNITLEDCSTSKSGNIYDLVLMHCENLRRINIAKCKFDPKSWLNRKYNQLESIYFRNDNAEVIDKPLARFLQLNRQMKHVIVQAFLLNLPVDLSTIAPNMENMTFGIHAKATPKNFQPIFDLPCLKQLSLYAGFSTNPVVCQKILEHFAAANTLESFGLLETNLTKKMLELIANMTLLKSLKLLGTTSTDKDAVKILSSSLRNIDSIYLCGGSFKFEMIREFIEKFPAMKTLYLHKTEIDTNATEQQLAEMIELRRTVATDWYTPLTICVSLTPSRKFVALFERKFLHNKYIKLVAASSDVFASKFIGIVD